MWSADQMDILSVSGLFVQETYRWLDISSDLNLVQWPDEEVSTRYREN